MSGSYSSAPSRNETQSHPLRFLRNLGRSREIATVLLNHGFGDLVDQIGLGHYLRWGKRVFFRKKAAVEPLRTRAERIRLAAESLGPTFIKFGQVASTRPDLVPEDVVNELAKLQERVPPFSEDEAVRLLESEFKQPVDKLFREFNRTPLAAGSLAPVTRAGTPDGEVVAVKIRRPKVVAEVERDLSLMFELAVLIQKHIPEGRVFDPVGLVQHFSRTIRRELNFLREGRTLDEFRRLFRNDATLYVPDVDWDHTREGVVSMEYIEASRIDDREAIQRLGLKPADLAANGARIFMKMSFELGIFHGDPHPGNIRVMDDGSICLLDYGMIGMITEEMRENLVDFFVAITRQDVRSAVRLVTKIGDPSGELDMALLRADVRDFVDNYYGIPLERMHVGRMLHDFVGILSAHGIRCPGDIMLLIRAIVTLEGVGRDLDPGFNLAQHLAPFVQRLVHERYNAGRILNRCLEDVKEFGRVAHALPLQVGRTLEKLSQDDLRMQLDHRGLDHLITEIDRSSNRIVVSLAMSSMILASALLIRQGSETLWMSVPIFILSSLLGMWLIYGVFRSGRL